MYKYIYDDDDAVSFMIFGVKSFVTFRWWCSWVLVLAPFPIFIFYVYWIPAAYLNREIDRITAVESSSDAMSYQNSEYCSLLNVVEIRNSNDMNNNNNNNNVMINGESSNNNNSYYENCNRRYGLFEEGSDYECMISFNLILLH
jgi:hypothetical protein